jgi:hypothetical protein
MKDRRLAGDGMPLVREEVALVEDPSFETESKPT